MNKPSGRSSVNASGARKIAVSLPAKAVYRRYKASRTWLTARCCAHPMRMRALNTIKTKRATRHARRARHLYRQRSRGSPGRHAPGRLDRSRDKWHDPWRSRRIRCWRSSRVRHVGDPVAFIVAETRDAAVAAMNEIDVDYESPALHRRSRNLARPRTRRRSGTRRPAISAMTGMSAIGAAVDKAFPAAAHVTTVKLINNRVYASPMETRGDDRPLRSIERPLHALYIEPEPACHPGPSFDRDAQDFRREDQGRRARCRRRLRHEDLSLCRGSPGGLRLAPVETPGQMDRRTLGSLRLRYACARSCDHRVAGARCERRRAGIEGRYDRQYGRLSLDLRAGDPVILLCLSDAGALQGACRALPHARGLHQHHAGRCLSRRRTARMHLCARTRHGCGSARDGDRPRRDAAAQSHSGRCVSL